MHDPFQVWAQEGNVLGFSDLGREQDPVPVGPKAEGVAEIEMGRKQNFLRKRGEMSICLLLPSRHLCCVLGATF